MIHFFFKLKFSFPFSFSQSLGMNIKSHNLGYLKSISSGQYVFIFCVFSLSKISHFNMRHPVSLACTEIAIATKLMIFLELIQHSFDMNFMSYRVSHIEMRYYRQRKKTGNNFLNMHLYSRNPEKLMIF